MTSYKIHFRLQDAKSGDYERSFRALKTELITRLRSLTMPSQYDLDQGAEFLYLGSGSLQEVTAAACLAAHTVGKEYRFTIIKQKRSMQLSTF
jgi:hypothetical protein